MIDYRELLRKYINHVGCCEGITFLSNIYASDFTTEEFAELQKLDKEGDTV